jgi:pyruvate dehydrogenase E2 component (dihydrolipoamide acetyltransferase)
MPIEVLMPALSPTMTEGNLAKWLKKEGDKISPGEVIAEIETDKATMEVEAVDEGVLGKIVIAAGTESVKVNEIIAIILEEGEDAGQLASYTAKKMDVAAPSNENKEEEPKLAVVKTAAATPSPNEGRVIASPLAKRIAENENIDLSRISGTGPHGRIIKDDVLEAKTAKPNAASVSAKSFVAGRDAVEYNKVPNNNMRKVIAKRLCESKQTVPHFYLSIECEIDNLLKTRAEMNSTTSKENPEYKLSVNDFVIKAVAMALRKVPAANSSWTDEAILQYNNVDVSVAVAIDGGLITPIVKNADQKSLSVISNEMKDLAARARIGKLAPEEFQGGGFSISNLGMYGIKNFKAIINPPQSCILAIGTSSERAIVRNGQVAVANIMDVSLSCDHRVVDGAVGAEFLNWFKKYIENPVLMLA